MDRKLHVSFWGGSNNGSLPAEDTSGQVAVRSYALLQTGKNHRKVNALGLQKAIYCTSSIIPQLDRGVCPQKDMLKQSFLLN